MGAKPHKNWRFYPKLSIFRAFQVSSSKFRALNFISMGGAGAPLISSGGGVNPPAPTLSPPRLPTHSKSLLTDPGLYNLGNIPTQRRGGNIRIGGKKVQKQCKKGKMPR